jgi:hypothetical protein
MRSRDPTLCTPGPAVTVLLVAGQARSGQVYYSAEVQDHEGQAEKTFESEQNEGAQMSLSNELERESAIMMVVIELWWRFRVIGADGAQVGYYCETEAESPSSTNPQRRSCFRSLRL